MEENSKESHEEQCNNRRRFLQNKNIFSGRSSTEKGMRRPSPNWDHGPRTKVKIGSKISGRVSCFSWETFSSVFKVLGFW